MKVASQTTLATYFVFHHNGFYKPNTNILVGEETHLIHLIARIKKKAVRLSQSFIEAINAHVH